MINKIIIIFLFVFMLSSLFSKNQTIDPPIYGGTMPYPGAENIIPQVRGESGGSGDGMIYRISDSK